MNILGIDVSKDTLDNHLDKNGKSEYIQVSNDFPGCLKLHEWLKSHKVRKVVIAMEATGTYYETVANYFSLIYEVYVINPLKIHEYAKSNFVRVKTDKTDSRLIAQYARTHLNYLHRYELPTSLNNELKSLSALYRQLKMQVVQTKNRLSIADNEFVVSALESVLNILQEQVKNTVVRIDKLLKQSVYKQQYENLQTITGISSKTAFELLNYLTVKQFANVNKFIAFAGLSPQIGQSGTSVKHKEKLTRYGHRKLKGAFYMPALVAYRSEMFKPFVERLRKQGKPKMVIIGALMRKLAKIAYCVYMKNEPFNKERHVV